MMLNFEFNIVKMAWVPRFMYKDKLNIMVEMKYLQEKMQVTINYSRQKQTLFWDGVS